MKLSKGQVVSLVVAIVTVVLTGIIHVGIREWYNPDVRYEEGSWYLSPSLALTSLKLTNYGHSDAENIRINAVFSQKISEVSTSDPGLPFNVVSGGKGVEMVSGNISRIVPGQALYVYIATDSPRALAGDQSFIQSVIFNGGQGKTGKPFFPFYFGILVGCIAGVAANVLMVRFQTRKLEKFYQNLDEAISFGITSAGEDLSEEQLEKRWLEQFGNEAFRGRTLKMAAQHAFRFCVKRMKASSKRG